MTVHTLEDGQAKSGVKYLKANGVDAASGAKVTIIWFHQTMHHNYIGNVVSGESYFVAGKATYSPMFHNYSIVAPTIFSIYYPDCQRIYPVYSKINGMSDAYLQSCITNALTVETESVKEPYPAVLAKHYSLPSYKDAMVQLHYPADGKSLIKAEQRMKFDKLLEFAIALGYNSMHSVKDSPYVLHDAALFSNIKSVLPYELTSDQNSIIMKIIEQMQSGSRVNALVQGDVGCGKTIIAIALMLMMAKEGFQCALMAPSKVLARQHAKDIAAFGEKFGIQTALYSSDMKKRERDKLLESVRNGTVKIIVGTHALLSDKLDFQNLALVITDEEHKFGVAQRASLAEKAENGVHVITMSATPIPRSLAQAVYGDEIDIHTVTQMPSGRKPVITKIVQKMERSMDIIEPQLAAGHQAFVVCPMIESSESSDNIASVSEIAEAYMKRFMVKGVSDPANPEIVKNVRIEILTGKTSKADTERIVQEFSDGKVDILIATTVVEVGVNIPNATVIVIHNAERFGLASLHQLRGRVGRSDLQSYCVLVSPETDNPRLQAMLKTNSGFDIAKADLQLRGPGEWLGEAQSGMNIYIQLMLAHPKVFKIVKDIANTALTKKLDWPIIRQVLEKEESE